MRSTDTMKTHTGAQGSFTEIMAIVRVKRACISGVIHRRKNKNKNKIETRQN